MAAKFPPALMKLFAPRPAPRFIKPTGPDPDKPGPHKLDGVASVLQRLREEEEEKVMKGEATGEEGKDKSFKLAAEYERQLKKEQKKKQQEEYKKNLEKNCG
jgi:U1 small nuclear ribonucleoprotein